MWGKKKKSSLPTDDEIEDAGRRAGVDNYSVRRDDDTAVYIDFDDKRPGKNNPDAYDLANRIAEGSDEHLYKDRGAYFEYTDEGFKFRKRKKGE